MAKKEIKIVPTEMTPAIMEELEKKKYIIRLSPQKHVPEAREGETKVSRIYQGEPGYGQHMLIGVTVNRTTLDSFGTHPDNEEFLLIGSKDTKPMYLVIALCSKEELDEKIRNKTLSKSDFTALTCKYNDPEVSFFVMLKNVPHGECVAKSDGTPASFYVTEPTDMGIRRTDFAQYSLVVDQ